MSFYHRALFVALTGVYLFSGSLWAAPQLDLEALKGRVVYIDFWASWCGPCRESFPWMKSLQDKYSKEGLTIIGVNVDQERKLADAFLTEFHPEFSIVFDHEGALATQFDVQAMPSSFMLDRSGKARYKHMGFVQEKRGEYEAEIIKLLDEKN